MEISRRKILIGGVGVSLLPANSLATTAQTNEGGHVVLLGDSIFDNKVYVGKEPAVIDQLKEVLGTKWQATLLAVDGHITRDIGQQLRKLPATATHLIVSVGGNDALMNQGILSEQVKSSTEVFQKLADLQSEFGRQYENMLDQVLKANKPVAVCTIYDPNFDEAIQNQLSIAALSVFNDRITRAAFSLGIPVIDLRLLFRGPQDYANPIEPGPVGGQKIAEQIHKIVTTHDFSKQRSSIYPGAR